MPFKSEAQRRWMFRNHPGMARRWAKHTSKGAKLPEHVSEHVAAESASMGSATTEFPIHLTVRFSGPKSYQQFIDYAENQIRTVSPCKVVSLGNLVCELHAKMPDRPSAETKHIHNHSEFIKFIEHVAETYHGRVIKVHDSTVANDAEPAITGPAVQHNPNPALQAELRAKRKKCVGVAEDVGSKKKFSGLVPSMPSMPGMAFDFDVPVGGSTLSKRALSIAIAEELGIAQAKTLSVVRMTLDKLALALMNGQRVELRGFGVFEMRRRKSRMRSNPNTGKIQHQPETFYVHFKPSQKIHEPRPGVYPGARFAYEPSEGVRMPAMQIPMQQETPQKQQSTEIKLYFEGEDLADEASLWLRQNGVQVRRPFEHSHRLTAIGDRRKINEAVDKFKGSPCKPRREVGTDQQAEMSYYFGPVPSHVPGGEARQDRSYTEAARHNAARRKLETKQQTARLERGGKRFGVLVAAGAVTGIGVVSVAYTILMAMLGKGIDKLFRVGDRVYAEATSEEAVERVIAEARKKGLVAKRVELNRAKAEVTRIKREKSKAAAFASDKNSDKKSDKKKEEEKAEGQIKKDHLKKQNRQHIERTAVPRLLVGGATAVGGWYFIRTKGPSLVMPIVKAVIETGVKAVHAANNWKKGFHRAAQQRAAQSPGAQGQVVEGFKVWLTPEQYAKLKPVVARQQGTLKRIGSDAAASYALAHLSLGPAVEFMLSTVNPATLRWLADKLINFGCEVIREQGKNALRVTAYGQRGPEAVRRFAARVGAQVQKVAMSYAMGAPGTQMILRSRGPAPTPTKVLADLIGSLFDAGIRAARRGKGIMAWISSQAELNKAKRIAQMNSMILESAMNETKRLRPDMVYSFGHENGYELGVGPTEAVEFIFSNALMVAAAMAYLRSKGLAARRNGEKSILCKVAEGGDKVMGSVYRTMDKHFEATVKMIMPGTEFLPSGGIHDLLPHGARVKLKKAQDVMGRAAKIPGQAKRMVQALPGAVKEAAKQGPKGFVPRTRGEAVLALTVTFATAAAAAAAASLIVKLGVKVKQAGQKLFAKPANEKEVEDVEQIIKAGQGKIVAASFMAEEAPMDWKIVFTSTSAAKHAYMPIATKYGFNPGVNISPRSKNIIFLNTKHSLITKIYDEYRLHGQAVDIQALGGYHPPAPGEGHGGPAGPGGGGAPFPSTPNQTPWADTGVPHDFKPGTNARGKEIPLDQYFTQFVIDFGGIIGAQRALAWLQRAGVHSVGEDGHGRLYVTVKNLLTRTLMAVVAAFRGKVVRKSGPSRKPQPVPTGRAAAPAVKAPAKQTIMPSQKPPQKPMTKSPTVAPKAKKIKETKKPEETKVTTIKDFRKQSKKSKGKEKGKEASHGTVAMALPLAAVGWWIIKDVLPYAATIIAADLVSSGILARVKNGEVIAQGDPAKIEKVAKRRSRRARVARAAKEVAGHRAASLDWAEQIKVAKSRLGDIRNYKAVGKAVYLTVAFAANAYLLGKFIKECTDAGAKTVTRPSGEVTVLTIDPARIQALAKDNKAISVKVIES